MDAHIPFLCVELRDSSDQSEWLFDQLKNHMNHGYKGGRHNGRHTGNNYGQPFNR
ncbi:hypothetical protein LTR14_012311, partial [Exophiala xenobiotica]